MAKIKIKRTQSKVSFGGRQDQAGDGSAGQGYDESPDNGHDDLPPDTGRRERAAPKKSSPIGIILAIFGWLGLIGQGVAIVMIMVKTDDMILQIRQERDQRLLQIPRDMEAAQTEYDLKQSDLETAIKELSTRKEELSGRKDTLTSQKLKLSAEVSDLVANEESLATELHAKLDEVRAAEKVLFDAQKVVLAKRAEKQRLYKEYKNRFAELTEELRAVLRTKQTNALQVFIQKYHHTPWGPAATYFLGELLYKELRENSAKPVYDLVIRRYPDCPYAEMAKKRLIQIEARKDFEAPEFPTMLPYKTLSILKLD